MVDSTSGYEATVLLVQYSKYCKVFPNDTER